MAQTVLELGRDHLHWGRYALRTTARSAIAISVGADARSPSMASKGDPRVPNEDAVAIGEDGDRTMLVVADAHYGIEASHLLVEAIARRPVPADFEELCALIGSLEVREPVGDSATTLLVAVVDRGAERGFGLSYGDASLVAVEDDSARILNVRVPRYLHPAPGSGIDPDEAQALQFFIRPGGLILAHTDGINECHYRSPASSIAPSHLLGVFDRTGPDPAAYAAAVVELALAGVDGNPGGQDNIALIATATSGGTAP